MPQLSTFHSQLSAFPAALPYNSELSLWLSVDPLSDKYPNLSPYVYCANNPVRLVDVDGREIYEFDNYGNYIRTIMCEGHDAVCIVNLDTKDVAYSQPYANGTISQLETDIYVNSANPDLQTANLFQVNSAEIATEIFEFIANNSNVEWGVVKNARTDDGPYTNFIGTNRANHANTITSIIDVRGYSLNGEVVHNHPSGTTIPSKKDVMQAAELEQKHPCIKFKTYVTPCRYLEYNGGSQYMEEFEKPLQRLEKHEK